MLLHGNPSRNMRCIHFHYMASKHFPAHLGTAINPPQQYDEMGSNDTLKTFILASEYLTYIPCIRKKIASCFENILKISTKAMPLHSPSSPPSSQPNTVFRDIPLTTANHIPQLSTPITQISSYGLPLSAKPTIADNYKHPVTQINEHLDYTRTHLG